MGDSTVFRFLILVFLAVISLAVATVVFLPFLPLDNLKPYIADAVYQNTGRKLTMKGPMRLQLFPNPRLSVDSVKMSNASWGKSQNFLSLERLDFELELAPLFKRELVIDSLILQRPAINLEISRSGEVNWDLRPIDIDLGTEEQSRGVVVVDASDEPADSGLAGFFTIDKLVFGDLSLKKGSLTFTNHETGTSEALSKINTRLLLSELNGPAAIEGDAVWKDQRFDIKTSVENLESFLNNQSVKTKLSLTSELASIQVDGSTRIGKTVTLDSFFSLSTPSLNRLVQVATGQAINASTNLFQKTSVSGQFSVAGSSIAAKDVTLALDQISGRGELNVNTATDVPTVNAALSLGQIDLSPYLNASGTASSGSVAASGTSGSQSIQWSNEPIDLSSLGNINGQFRLVSEGLTALGYKLGPSDLSVSLDNRRAQVQLNRASLYGGAGTGFLVLNARNPGELSWSTDLQLQGIQAAPILQTSMNLDRLSAVGNAQVKLLSWGLSQRDFIRNLKGSLGCQLRDGSYRGIDIQRSLRSLQAGRIEVFKGENHFTKFTEFTGSGTVNQGQISNQDLVLFGPFLAMTGQGQVNLPGQSLQYRLYPKVGASWDTQVSGDAGLTIPLIVRGPWSNIDIKPDLEAIAAFALKNPQQFLALLPNGLVPEDLLPKGLSVDKLLSGSVEEKVETVISTITSGQNEQINTLIEKNLPSGMDLNDVNQVIQGLNQGSGSGGQNILDQLLQPQQGNTRGSNNNGVETPATNLLKNLFN